MMTYCKPFQPNHSCVEALGKEFVKLLKVHMPDMLNKPKIHLLLHLSNSMEEFGPASCFNTERLQTITLLLRITPTIFDLCRCEAFNKVMKSYNVHSNRRACSRDIATRFAKVEHLQFMCSTGRCSLEDV